MIHTHTSNQTKDWNVYPTTENKHILYQCMGINLLFTVEKRDNILMNFIAITFPSIEIHSFLKLRGLYKLI